MATSPSVFDGYTIRRANIASGSAGVVHEAVSTDGTRVAIKVLNRNAVETKLVEIVKKAKPGIERRPDELSQEVKRQYDLNVDAFKAEYGWLVNLNHPNIAKVHGIGFYEGHFYIASEFIEGKTIAEHVRDWKPVEMIPLFIQALQGLDYIHRNGLIHLDIKPDNILVQTINNKPVVKIIDFGLAITPEAYTGGFCGTVATMAPEVALGQKELVDARADLFSFGVVMYFCITWGLILPLPRSTTADRDAVRRSIKREAGLTLEPPSRFHRRREGYVPQFLDTIVMRLLAHDPVDRFYTNARAVINALTTHLTDAFQDTPETLGSYLRPEMNRYIGRDAELQTVQMNIQALIEGNLPTSPIICVVGSKGFGKTHFLKCLREIGEKHIEKLSIHTLSFPASNDVLETRVATLTKQLSENTKPLLVLIDNLDELPTSAATSSIQQTLSGLVLLIADRQRSDATYSDIEPVMLVLATKSMDFAQTPLADYEDVITTIELTPFSEGDIREYLLATPALKGKEITPERVEVLYRKTNGIPLELVETLQELDSKGVLFNAAGELVLADIQEIVTQAPQSTRERLLAQYRALPRPEQEAVEFIACWTCKPFLPLLHEKNAFEILQPSRARQVLHSLMQKGIIQRTAKPIAYSFTDSDYMPELIHEVMEKNVRGATHAIIATYLKETTQTDKAESQNTDRAINFHLAYGIDHQAAIRKCIFLGREMLYREGRCTIAIELLKRALELTDQSKQKLSAYIYLLLAEAYYYCNNPDASSRASSAGMAAVTNQSVSWKTAFVLRSIAYCLNAGDLDKAKQQLDGLQPTLNPKCRTIAYLLARNYEARYYLESSIQSSQHSVEYLSKARDLFEENRQLEQQLPSNISSRINNNYLHRVQRLLGDYNSAAITAETRLNQKVLNTIDHIKAVLELADIHRLAHKFDQALDCASKALLRANDLNLGFYTYLSYGVLANIYHDRDDFETSIAASNKRIAAGACLTNRDEYRQLSAHVWTHMGHCYKELRTWDKAIVYFDAAIGCASDVYTKMSSYYGLGVAFYHKQQFDKMFEYFSKADDLIQGLPRNEYVDSYRYRILALKVRTYIQQTDCKQAQDLFPALKELAGMNSSKLLECNEIEKLLTLQN